MIPGASQEKKKTLKKLTTDLMPCEALGGGLYSNLA
jgi:hypothetical protein